MRKRTQFGPQSLEVSIVNILRTALEGELTGKWSNYTGIFAKSKELSY